ncbi:MAG: dipeptide ABC transporter ATP-binding protein [gamma proteobacterium symbiont of Bathyaustriella thionipta]|nr:dipeptide ABC transporter ATP-binding protein [gamma proteobacterium symbiont of Bathyaustriella thionipta]MCU7950577.1 dipeptide ABC transporter ATP-binding protein [gamma proteobacterium symbiont of Bathyaustriella thionipta]MCU7954643.1 dipeptide ABC transporter ATP-binding protein [gamma proteobacterium symbiont of Bathyaustriella thionipta]MCU7957087.1 dipeptide ABC transporter ATP-binding protein [gamma proteobacterium symbiont of Bathyaustriella thionipta]MCU7966305.1 dipeptide ABC tr
MMKQSSILDIKDLNVDFDTLAGSVNVVRDINFSVAAGETMALVGESGSGKSVTAMSILRLHDEEKVNYTSGSISFLGKNLLGADENSIKAVRGSEISMIFQEPMTSLNPTFTVGDQIMEPLLIHKGMSKPAAKKRTIELMELTGIPEPHHRFNAFPHLLSGGQRQRMMISMALACEPKLLIADEPTTALDVTVQLQILLLLEKLKKEFSMAVLMITHDLNLVKRFADNVCVMQEGNIVEQGRVDYLFDAPQHPYTIKLLNSEPERIIPENETLALRGNKELLSGHHLMCHFSSTKGFIHRITNTIKAVDNIDLVLREGETLGIVGESGSGKSTLGRCLLKLENCSGDIYFDQQQIDHLKHAALRPLRKEFQVVFQDPYSSLSPRMTIEQIVGEGLQIHFPHLDKEQRREKIQKVLLEVGLEQDILWRYPHEFSGGQRQRIAIARVVILEPKLILLDEPTSALDVSVQKQVLVLLRELQERHKISYLFITHDLKVIEAVAHRIMVMKEGKIIETGETNDVFNRPREIYTQNLLTASLFKDIDEENLTHN